MFHTEWVPRMRAGEAPDRAYHRKVVEGLLQPTWAYMDDHEANAVMFGRQRHDGRRLDHWVLPDPLEDSDG